jgi:hypothetical protein
MFDEVDVEIQPDQEHVEDQADLRGGVQHDVRRSWRKKVVLDSGSDPAQQRRPE